MGKWIADVQAERAALECRRKPPARRERMTEDEIAAMVEALGRISAALQAAHPDDKAEVYRKLSASSGVHQSGVRRAW